MDNKIKFIAMRLSAMTPESIGIIYKEKLEKWFYRKSHKKEWKQNYAPYEFNDKNQITNSQFISELSKEEWLSLTIPQLKHNNNGKIINAEFSKKTESGFDLTEKQFIENELHELSKFDYQNLKVKEQATIKFYKKFLESKLIEPNNNLNDVEYRQDIFTNRFAFEVFKNLHQRFKDSPTQMANYSFIYRKMVEQELIRDSFKPSQFISFISSEPYNVDKVEQLKTLERIGKNNVVRQNFNAIVDQTKEQKTTVV